MELDPEVQAKFEQIQKKMEALLPDGYLLILLSTNHILSTDLFNPHAQPGEVNALKMIQIATVKMIEQMAANEGEEEHELILHFRVGRKVQRA